MQVEHQVLPIALPTLVIAGAVVLVAFVLLVVLLRILRRRPASKAGAPQDLSIDIKSLDASGPPAKSPRLEFYGTPVRLVVFVLAPVGRGGNMPSAERLREVVDYLVPGLSKVLAVHQPIYRQWPPQLSSQGFARALFANVRLPGDDGKGTPWCSVAGKFSIGEEHLLAGLVCCAAGPNGLSQVTVEHEGQWLDVLRVKE
jgi:hypothetical protein